MSEQYNIGDRVMAVPYNDYFEDGLPRPATVVSYYRYPDGYLEYGLRFDEYVNGHNLNGGCEDGYGFWQSSHSIRGTEYKLTEIVPGNISMIFGGV